MIMSNWKKFENWYILDELLFGYNCYWWGGCAVDNNLSGNNKGLYRTMWRTAKNKKRKQKYFQRKINMKGIKLHNN